LLDTIKEASESDFFDVSRPLKVIFSFEGRMGIDGARHTESTDLNISPPESTVKRQAKSIPVPPTPRRRLPEVPFLSIQMILCNVRFKFKRFVKERSREMSRFDSVLVPQR
jgi:hypothetical protein